MNNNDIVQKLWNLCDITEEDAQTALHCLSLLLIELGLAKY